MKPFWDRGRQGTGYLKKLLAHGKAWDLYLLKYPKGSHIPAHTDPVPGAEHHRINVCLWRARKGGEFWARGMANGRRSRRVVYFRSDETLHGVSRVEEGTRYVLSFGFLRHTV